MPIHGLLVSYRTLQRLMIEALFVSIYQAKATLKVAYLPIHQ
jgi:hypothetical protein